MNNSPITNAKVSVICPSTALNIHAAIQQIIPASQQGIGRDSTIVVLQRADLARLFNDGTPVTSFYVLENGIVSYISLRNDKGDETELFANFIQLNQDLVDKVFAEKPTATSTYSLEHFIYDIEKEYEVLPTLRMRVLIPSETFPASPVAECVTVLDDNTWKQTNVMFKWDAASIHWIGNDEPVKEIIEKKRLHLKDIPLNTRNGRRLVRNSIEEALVTLTDLHMRSASQLSFDEWMTQSQGVHMKALRDLEIIDSLSDEEYVEAMVTFKKAEAQAYHSQAIKNKSTDLHLFDWVLENFGQEFNDLGRKEAQAEIMDVPVSNDEVPAEEGDEEFIPAVFLVSFDGCVVEDQLPIIGPESPFSIPTLKKLIQKGHQVIILTDRVGLPHEELVDFFKRSEIAVLGSVNSMTANGIIFPGEISFFDEETRKAITYTIMVDYLIDHRQFAAPMVQISGRANHGSTLYWGDLVSQLVEENYLTEEDVEDIKNTMDPEANQ